MAIPIDEDVVSIGRDVDCDIHLKDETCSRVHCRIFRRESSFMIKDAGSFNGTHVNDLRIDSVELNEDSCIKVGNTLMRFGYKEKIEFVPHRVLDSAPVHPSSEILVEIRDLEAGLDSDCKSTYEAMVESIGAVSTSSQFSEVRNDLEFVYNSAIYLSKQLDRRQLFYGLLELILEWLGAEKGVVVLLDDDHTDFSHRVMRCLHPKPNEQTSEVRYNRRLMERVAHKRVGACTSFQVSTPDSSSTAGDGEPKTIHALCAPVISNDKLFGIIYIDTDGIAQQAKCRFNRCKLRLLISLANQAATAIENQNVVVRQLTQERFAAVGELTSVISHRVNNILQVINGGSYLVDFGVESSDWELVKKGWSIVKRNQNRITRLTTNLLSYSRVFEPSPSIEDLNTMLGKAIQAMGDSYDVGQIEFTYDDSDSCAVFIDGYFTTKVIENLLSVALAASLQADTPRPIKVGTKSEGDFSVMVIEFRHFDERFDLPSMVVGPADKLKAEMGMLELMVSKRHIEAQNGELEVVSGLGNTNIITAKMPRFQLQYEEAPTV